MDTSFFSKINYSAANEDGKTERLLLNPRLESGTALCISGSGSRPLELALSEPKKIVSVDFNPTQNFLLQLKLAAIAQLDYSEFLKFLGVREASGQERIEVFENLKKHLTDDAQVFWEKHPQYIREGILYCGVWERYLNKIASFTRVFQGEKTNRLLECTDLPQQIKFGTNPGTVWVGKAYSPF